MGKACPCRQGICFRIPHTQGLCPGIAPTAHLCAPCLAVPAQVLKRERDERIRAAAEEAVKKLHTKLAARVSKRTSYSTIFSLVLYN